MVLSQDELQHIGVMWCEECPDLAGLAATGEPDNLTIKGLIKALDICRFTGDYLQLHDIPEWQRDVDLLKQALHECRWYAYAKT